MRKLAYIALFGLAFGAVASGQDTEKDLKLKLVLSQRSVLVYQIQSLQIQYERAQAEIQAKVQANNQALTSLGKDPANFEFDAKTGDFVEQLAKPVVK